MAWRAALANNGSRRAEATKTKRTQGCERQRRNALRAARPCNAHAHTQACVAVARCACSCWPRSFEAPMSRQLTCHLAVSSPSNDACRTLSRRPSARMAFLAVGALGAAGGFLGTQLLRRGGRASSPSGSDRRSDRAAAPPPPKAPARGVDERDSRAAADAAGVLAALPPWQPLPLAGSGGDVAAGLAWDPAAPPQSPWEAQAQMQRWSLAQALAAERQQVALLAALHRAASWAQDGERGAPAPAMHLSVNVSSSAEAAPPPAPPEAPGAANAAAKVTADVSSSWRDALLRVALRALATVALWESGKAALRRRRLRKGQTGLQLLGRAALRRATALQRGDGGGTHKWGFIVL